MNLARPIEIACQCDDFPGSHRGGTGACMGWCDQTCTEYRPVMTEEMLMNDQHPEWQAILAKASELQMPTHYTSDLFRDYQTLNAKLPDHFVWGVRSTGTSLLLQPDEFSFARFANSDDETFFAWHPDTQELQPVTTAQAAKYLRTYCS